MKLSLIALIFCLWLVGCGGGSNDSNSSDEEMGVMFEEIQEEETTPTSEPTSEPTPEPEPEPEPAPEPTPEPESDNRPTFEEEGVALETTLFNQTVLPFAQGFNATYGNALDSTIQTFIFSGRDENTNLFDQILIDSNELTNNYFLQRLNPVYEFYTANFNILNKNAILRDISEIEADLFGSLRIAFSTARQNTTGNGNTQLREAEKNIEQHTNYLRTLVSSN